MFLLYTESCYFFLYDLQFYVMAFSPYLNDFMHILQCVITGVIMVTVLSLLVVPVSAGRDRVIAMPTIIIRILGVHVWFTYVLNVYFILYIVFITQSEITRFKMIDKSLFHQQQNQNVSSVTILRKHENLHIWNIVLQTTFPYWEKSVMWFGFEFFFLDCSPFGVHIEIIVHSGNLCERYEIKCRMF